MCADCPVSPAALARPATFSLTTLVLWATVVTECAISRGVASFCATAGAAAEKISLILDNDADALDCRHRVPGGVLDRADLAGDLLGRARGLRASALTSPA